MIFKTLTWMEMLPVTIVDMLQRYLHCGGKQSQDLALIKPFHPGKCGINVQYKQLHLKGIVSKQWSFQFTIMISCLLGPEGHRENVIFHVKISHRAFISLQSRRASVRAAERSTSRSAEAYLGSVPCTSHGFLEACSQLPRPPRVSSRHSAP